MKELLTRRNIKKIKYLVIAVLFVISLSRSMQESSASLSKAEIISNKVVDVVNETLSSDDILAGEVLHSENKTDNIFGVNDTEKVEVNTESTTTSINIALEGFVDLDGKNYKILVIDGGDLRGTREPMSVVDVGFGDREYFAFTNEYAQLFMVTAKEIILQNAKTEPLTNEGRYYHDEAKVPGTEHKDLDEGHVIADSLGGVANAYNITPQSSTLNRHGDQAYMEKVIRTALYEGLRVTNFKAEIFYQNNETMIPSKYRYTYEIDGELVVDEFDNVNPDEPESQTEPQVEKTPVNVDANSSIKGLTIASVDLRGEVVILINTSNSEINIAGYQIVSVKGNQSFILPNYLLKPGETVSVYSKGGSGNIKWSDSNIWNNDGDPAELYDPDNNLLQVVN